MSDYLTAVVEVNRVGLAVSVGFLLAVGGFMLRRREKYALDWAFIAHSLGAAVVFAVMFLVFTEPRLVARHLIAAATTLLLAWIVVILASLAACWALWRERRHVS